MTTPYQPNEVELQAQQYWQDNGCCDASEDLNREKFYCLSMLPYPSGELHMGHVRNYTIGDTIARYEHMKGKNVLQPMGWDAFGLPAENAAIKHDLPPSVWTKKNIKKMRKQFQQLGFAFDWSREIATCDSDYYRWEQWLFTKLYKKGLIYSKEAMVNWDPVDQTVLANEQVIDGKGWRSGAPIERKRLAQWFIKITDYAQSLLDDLDELTGWPEQVRTMQRNWIGRSEGVNITFPVVKRSKMPLQIFTTRPDTLMGATYLAIAIEHPLAIEAATIDNDVKNFIQQSKQTQVSEAELAKQDKKGIFTGFYATHPITKKKLPIWITNFVLIEYGSGAVMAVPAHDQRDFEFAKQYELPIQQVIAPPKKTPWDFSQGAYTEMNGSLINSDEFDGLRCKKAAQAITQHLVEHEKAEVEINFRLRDWGISRQRYWGAPIPIIHCKTCGAVPVPESDLPVVLPTDLIPDGKTSPLKTSADFYKTTCPVCGKAAKRETDTMDTFVESSWYYARYCCADQNNAMLDDRAKYWTPVDHYIGGIEHAVLHLLYARFMHKVLRDEGLINSNEPFKKLLTQGMVLKNGSKMSKSKGNIVSPHSLLKQYGADTIRFFIIFTAPPEQDLEWSDSGVEGAHRFLKKLWALSQQAADVVIPLNENKASEVKEFDSPEQQSQYREINQILQQASYDMERQQFNTVASAAMKILNTLQKIDSSQDQGANLLQQGLSVLLRMLMPITPHISHHLWQTLKFADNIMTEEWPKVNIKSLSTDTLEIMIQLNGKLRGKLTISTQDDNEAIEQAAINDPGIQKHVNGSPIKKCIIVPKKLINIVI